MRGSTSLAGRGSALKNTHQGVGETPTPLTTTPMDFFGSWLGLEVACVIGETIYKQIEQREFERVAKNFRSFWKIIDK